MPPLRLHEALSGIATNDALQCRHSEEREEHSGGEVWLHTRSYERPHSVKPLE